MTENSSEAISKLYTIGVYDSDEESFFGALTDANITVFCDVRARRGLRGSRYAYANSAYLQDKLSALDITYRHFKELAPSKAVRDAQDVHDKQNKVARRDRTQLSDAFIEAYQQDILVGFDVDDFLSHFQPDDVVVLFCVEGAPTACHRSLLAGHIADTIGIEVEHLQPKSTS